MLTYIAVFVFAILLLKFPKLVYRNMAPLVAVATAFIIFNQSQIVELFVVLGEQIRGEADVSVLGFSLFPRSLLKELAATVLAGTSIYFWARIASWSWLREYLDQEKLTLWEGNFARLVQRLFPFFLLGVYLWIVGTRFIAIRSGLWVAFFACATVMLLADYLLARELEDGMVHDLAAESTRCIRDRIIKAFEAMGQVGSDQFGLAILVSWLFVFVAMLPLVIAALFFSWLARPLRWLVHGEQHVAGNTKTVVHLPSETRKEVPEAGVLPCRPEPYYPVGDKNVVSSPVAGIGMHNPYLVKTTAGYSDAIAPIAGALLSLLGLWWPLLFSTGVNIVSIAILAALFLMAPALQFLFFFVLVIALVIWPPLSSSIGAVALINLFVACCLSLYFLLMRMDPRGRLVAFPLLLALGLAFLDLNDNHGIRTIDEPVAPLMDAETAFDSWLADRFRTNDSGTAPVYVVAAPGGGIYAAHQAALMLSQLEDEIPEFSHHLFAISGVSGGSVGAALFAGLVHENATIPLPDGFEEASSKFLIHDFLSTTTSMTLFNDSLARVLPLRQWDRALAIEGDFADAWSSMQPGRNWFDASFYEHWKPDGNTPALLLNTTQVEDGQRVVISPFRLNSIDNVATTLYQSSDFNLRMSTAVGLSARFPGLSPAGSFIEKRSGVKRRLVDGGYADNSGVATALDLIHQLRSAKSEHSCHLVLLVLRFKDYPTSPGQGLSELSSPLRTLNSTRAARSLEWIDIARRELGNDDSIRELWLDTGATLPLGWKLSTSNQDAIRASLKAKNEPEVTKIRDEIRRAIRPN